MNTRILLLLTLSIVTACIVLYIKATSIARTIPTDCIPTFQDGDGPYYISNAPFRDVLVPATASGEVLRVRGTLFRNDCKTAVAGAVIDIWQADDTGTYTPDWYRGRITTDKNGSYDFRTVMPKGYGEGTGYRPPHIHFKVWEQDVLRITSEMFFPEVRGRAGFADAYIMKLKSRTKLGKIEHEGYHDIILP